MSPNCFKIIGLCISYLDSQWSTTPVKTMFLEDPSSLEVTDGVMLIVMTCILLSLILCTFTGLLALCVIVPGCFISVLMCCFLHTFLYAIRSPSTLSWTLSFLCPPHLGECLPHCKAVLCAKTNGGGGSRLRVLLPGYPVAWFPSSPTPRRSCWWGRVGGVGEGAVVALPLSLGSPAFSEVLVCSMQDWSPVGLVGVTPCLVGAKQFWHISSAFHSSSKITLSGFLVDSDSLEHEMRDGETPGSILNCFPSLVR